MEGETDWACKAHVEKKCILILIGPHRYDQYENWVRLKDIIKIDLIEMKWSVADGLSSTMIGTSVELF
jgi:hypothetical protein